ncbi:MAG: hypothetical protein FJ125_16430, partial [Deltaproteobacteria bacterium]|nr:hypothetical protein [Deltaproteobacteria bacterium]
MIPMGVRVLDGDSGSPWRQFNGEEPPPWGMDKPAPADAPAEMISRWERWREIIFDVRAKIDMALSGAVAEASRRGPRLSLVGPMGQPLDKVRPKGVAVAGPDPDGPLGAINLTAVLLRALRQASPAGEDERTRHRRAKVLEGQV